MSRVANILEISKELHQPGRFKREQKVAIEDEYRLLSSTEGRELGHLALATLDTASKKELETLEEILVSLACLVPDALNGLHETLAAKEIFYPAEIFRGADDKSRDALVQRVAWDDKNRNNLLKALAWIGDIAVQNQFHLWRDTPPEWQNKLFIPADAYAQEAGWVLTAEGGRRDLYSSECYTIVRLPETDDPPLENPVSVIEVYPEHCQWCDWEMTTLFDFSLALPPFAHFNLHGERLRIVMCDRCSGFATIFMDVDMNGGSTWAQENIRPEFIGWKRDDYARLPVNRMTLGVKRRTPYEANWQVLEQGHSQIGGHPAWVDDAEYPKCPRCLELMTFIAQLQTDDLEDYMEGTTYAFCCSPCGKATTVYQQT